MVVQTVAMLLLVQHKLAGVTCNQAMLFNMKVPIVQIVWIGGVHTVLVTGVSGGSVQIVEANNPGGSGYVSSNSNWSPAPPAGFRAVVWRFSRLNSHLLIIDNKEW